MLPVDGEKLKEWLEQVALPKVSDADPAALSEYIVLLLDSIDLTFLDQSTKQQCVGKLHEFFETHTEPFVDELFVWIAKHRESKEAAVEPQPASASHRHSSSSASTSHRDTRRRHSRSRSRSPSHSISRSRSRSRSADRDRDRRRRRSRDEEDDAYKRRDRDGRDERDNRGGMGSRGSELVRDYRFSGSGRGGDGGRGGERYVDVRDRGQVERRDYRAGASSGSWQPVHHVLPGRRSQPYDSPPLVIQRPYVPPSQQQQTEEIVRQPRRTVLMPASNPFNTVTPANQTTTATDTDTAADTVRVGHHIIVKRKRVDTAETAQHTAPHTSPPTSHSGAAATLLLSSAPRFILNIKLLMEHFSRFGGLLGIEIQEAAGTATVKYGTADDVLRALMGPPLHPQARLTVLPAQQPHAPSNGSQPVTRQVRDGEQHEEEEEEAEEEEEEDTYTQSNGTNQSIVSQPHTSAPTATLSVGKHTITLRPKATQSQHLPQLPPTVQPTVPTEPPAIGSALHTAQLIRQQKQTQQQQQQHPKATPPPPTTQPHSIPSATTLTPTPPPPSASASLPSTPLTAADKEHRTAVKKMQLLQAQIEQQERLMQRLEAAMAGQVSGSMEYNSLYAKKLDMDLTVEETRRQWREVRGKVVMLAIKAGNVPTAAPPAADSKSSATSASAMTV